MLFLFTCHNIQVLFLISILCIKISLTSILPPSPLHSDSVLPECSTTLKRLVRPSVRPLRTGLSLVVVERAQAEPPPPPPPMGLCWRLHRLRSLVDGVPSSLEVEPKNRRVSSHSLSQNIMTTLRHNVVFILCVPLKQL